MQKRLPVDLLDEAEKAFGNVKAQNTPERAAKAAEARAKLEAFDPDFENYPEYGEMLRRLEY